MPVRRAGRPLTTCPHNPGTRCDCRPGAIAAAANTTPLQVARSPGSGKSRVQDTTSVSAAPDFTPDWTSTVAPADNTIDPLLSFSSTSPTYPPSQSLGGASASLPPVSQSVDPYPQWATPASSSTPYPWPYGTDTSLAGTGILGDTSQATSSSLYTFDNGRDRLASAAISQSDHDASFIDYLISETDPVYDDGGTQDDDLWIWSTEDSRNDS